ncbi:proline iminopeptidase isoform X2 [Manihot esculenta]|uniref:proline iminopeptidase isoform X2 n=1 Tax=Manihot esculenta TaxID=3983 RepID=UPI000B5D1982|nr:proline iminopeptidase isoform X2 [Manihot esculenta]
MLVNYAQPSLIKPILLASSLLLYPRSTSRHPPHSLPNLLHFHCRRSSLNTFATMAEAKHAASYSPPEHHAGTWYSVPDLRLRDHRFIVPLDYSIDRSASPKISIFVREVVAVGKEEQQLPYLLYLQGGPGFECPRPTEASGWVHKACEGFRVVLMDQRGTGLSTPLTSSSMLQLDSAEKLVDYLKHFRADNIVNDAEFIRVRLVPDSGPWTILGQVIRQNEKYYERFPQDAEIVREVVIHLAESEGGGVLLPSGGILTPRGLQTLGLSGLGSSAGFERLHYMFERVWDPVLVPGSRKQISHYFLKAFENWLDFDSNPLYALLHESIYCQDASSSWSAYRILAEDNGKFDAIRAAKEGRPVFFTGENVFPWMFDEIHALRKFKDAAQLLAKKKDWPPLYDIAMLKNNKVPVAAAVYYEDMYVNFKLAMETASQIGGIRLWITNEYMHSGLRDAGGRVFDHLLGMLNGNKPLF